MKPMDILQILFGLGSIGKQNKLENQYTADTDQQIADAQRIAAQIGSETLQTYDDSAANQLQTLTDRYSTSRDYGKQMAADIDDVFNRQQAAFRLNPLSRGSTVGSTVSRNIDRDRMAEQRRLGEDLTRLRLGLQGDIAGFYGGQAANRANIVNQGYRDMLSTVMGIDRVPPPPNQLPFIFGQNLAPVPKPPEQEGLWERWGPTGSGWWG